MKALNSMKHHELKILPRYFEKILEGSKLFEIRKNDRDFQEGDLVTLLEWKDGKYTGSKIERMIGHISIFEQKENIVVFSLLYT